MEEFRFENTVLLSESQYVAIWSVLPSTPWWKKLRLIALITVGVLFLFSTYTLLIGLILLGLAAIAVYLPGILLPYGTRSIFRRHIYLRDPITYGVNDQKLWVKSVRIDASVKWSMLVTWREVEGWLLLSSSGIPPIVLSISRLKEEGVYDRVRDFAKRHAPEYNKASPHKPPTV